MSDPVFSNNVVSISESPKYQNTRFDGGGGGGPVDPNVTWRDYVDSRDAAVEARIQSEFANLRADIARLPKTGTLIGTGIAIVSIIVAVLAFGGTRFSGGLAMSDVLFRQAQRDEKQDSAVLEINKKLDLLIARKEPDK